MSTDLAHRLDIADTVAFIRSHNAKSVALQFPDRLLSHAAFVVHSLQSQCDCKCFVLADTSYGSCCVDEVAAQHVNAQVIIHYGETCGSPTAVLPVKYVFDAEPIDVVHFASSLPALFEEVKTSAPNSNLVVLYDQSYAWAVPTLRSSVAHLPVTIADIVPPGLAAQPHPDMVTVCGLQFPLSAASSAADSDSSNTDYVQTRLTQSSTVLVFIGSEGPMLTTVMLNFAYLSTYSYDPRRVTSETTASTWRLESALVNKSLARRYFLVQKAKDSDIIGLVAGTLAVRDYRTALQHCGRLIRECGKKCYTVAVGKPNVAKLGNLPEIDLYVLVACPFASLLDSRTYTRDVITPFELELALAPGIASCTLYTLLVFSVFSNQSSLLSTGREWSGAYSTDFRQILPELGAEARFSTPVDAVAAVADDDNDGVRFSMVTGKLKQSHRSIKVASAETSATRDLICTNQTRDMVISGGGETSVIQRHLQRSWKGLEAALGQTAVASIEQGLSGIARGYVTEMGQARAEQPDLSLSDSDSEDRIAPTVVEPAFKAAVVEKSAEEQQAEDEALDQAASAVADLLDDLYA
jgi:diphthamide biosynthesis protein 2